ncbi:MAG: hypothetical protein HY736_16775 [Verrucomicrobia bacterium]|nr:hypothetical protein [Verrucomicrobiota bacterium]
MCASPLGFLRAGPPPPNVALLPDALFFTRPVPIAAGATPAETAAQVELALEAVSPFPLAQLYYGWFTAPGAEHAFVFAAYRRRFTVDQTAAWGGAELVMPGFAAVLGTSVEPATTIVLAAPEGVTAVHWETPRVPSAVLCRPVEPDATDEDRARVRGELLRAIGESKTVIDVAAPLTPEPAKSDREVVFRSGDFISRLPIAAGAALDVRDKGELAAFRRARQRDVLLWRVMLGCAAALLLLAVGEFALLGGKAWQKVRVAKLNAQKPLVDKIKNSDALARRIDELATKRLLPFEMITILDGGRPGEITFTRVVASTQTGIYMLTVDATATNAGQVSVYRSALEKLPSCEKVEIRNLQTRGDTATFTLVVTFKPEAIAPAQSISA